jgi:hypothetical protein
MTVAQVEPPKYEDVTPEQAKAVLADDDSVPF